MADCKIRSFNAKRAMVFLWKLTLIGWVILRRSKPHIHNEFQFSERYNNVSVSATLADGANSVRLKFNGYSHKAERWDTNVVPMTDEQEDLAWKEACRLAGLPIDWLTLDKLCQGEKYYAGKTAVKYDKVGQICHILPWTVWKPSKGKTWCTKTVNLVTCAGRPDWERFLREHPKIKFNELMPDQLHYMSEYYFRKVA